MEAEVQEIRRSFWRGRVTRVIAASRDREGRLREVSFFDERPEIRAALEDVFGAYREPVFF